MKNAKGMSMKYKINSWEKFLTKTIVRTQAIAGISARYGMLSILGLTTTLCMAAPKAITSNSAADASTATPNDVTEAPQYIVPTAAFPTGLDTRTKIVPPSPTHKHGNHAQYDKNVNLNKNNHLPVKAQVGRRLAWTKGYRLVSLKKNK
ncbi:MAG: hypothetical protein V4525_13930 [Pseudomonadota bacterium]